MENTIPKQYIILQTNNREYLIRVDKNKKKYILVRDIVLLSSIKNKYRNL